LGWGHLPKDDKSLRAAGGSWVIKYYEKKGDRRVTGYFLEESDDY